MIRHICMFSLKEENKTANAAEFLRQGEELGRHPTIRGAQVVGKTQGAPNANYDMALIFDFDSLEELNAYQVSPEHVAFGRFVGEIRLDRACIDYEV